jgi:hypothetical protein
MTNNELTYFDALKRITKYQSVESLQRRSRGDYGLDSSEAIEYAYENVIQEARNAIRGKRRPVPKQPKSIAAIQGEEKQNG